MLAPTGLVNYKHYFLKDHQSKNDCGFCYGPLASDENFTVVAHEGPQGKKHPMHLACATQIAKFYSVEKQNKIPCPYCQILTNGTNLINGQFLDYWDNRKIQNLKKNALESMVSGTLVTLTAGAVALSAGVPPLNVGIGMAGPAAAGVIAGGTTIWALITGVPVRKHFESISLLISFGLGVFLTLVWTRPRAIDDLQFFSIEEMILSVLKIIRFTIQVGIVPILVAAAFEFANIYIREMFSIKSLVKKIRAAVQGASFASIGIGAMIGIAQVLDVEKLSKLNKNHAYKAMDEELLKLTVIGYAGGVLGFIASRLAALGVIAIYKKKTL